MNAYQVLSEQRGIDELAERDGIDVLVVETDAAGRVTQLNAMNRFLQNLVKVKQ